MLDPDRYYTPGHVADRVADAVGSESTGRLIDSSCGSGSLLRAAASRFPTAQCLGIDSDETAIARLASANPRWTLVIGNSLDISTWIANPDLHADIAVLNPPFSMESRCGHEIAHRGKTLRASTAMAHLVAVVNHASPRVVSAVLPESWAYSELDWPMRRELAKMYDCEIVERLSNSTFGGARANSLLVRLTRRSRRATSGIGTTLSRSQILSVVRGGLPVFEARRSVYGLPYVHSTALKTINSPDAIDRLYRVRQITRGTVAGNVILLPRVGRPTPKAVQLLYLRRTVQLSDCVIAIKSQSKDHLAKLRWKIDDEWASFVDIYRGTGARYTTVANVLRWIG